MGIEGALLVMARRRYQERKELVDVQNLLLDMGVETVRASLLDEVINAANAKESVSLLHPNPSQRIKAAKTAFKIKQRFFLNGVNTDHEAD